MGYDCCSYYSRRHIQNMCNRNKSNRLERRFKTSTTRVSFDDVTITAVPSSYYRLCI